MKGNAKGFTLVELLAVIVILGIVALVTTPAILNVINDARENGAEDKAWGTIDAVRLAYTQSQSMDNDTVIANNFVIDFSSEVTNQKVGNRKITVSGERPKSGTVSVDVSTGTITCEDLEFIESGHYYCSTIDGNTMECSTSK